MKISFDLDNTLIPANKSDFPVIRRNFIQRLLNIELLREGSKELIQNLKYQGHEIGIYTTSYRSKLKIRLQLFTYGISVQFVINETFNRKELKRNNVSASKYPPAFGIDLHIDDSKGVAIEGERLNFRTIIIEKEQMNWTCEILKNVS